jgi:hypothetical protein
MDLVDPSKRTALTFTLTKKQVDEFLYFSDGKMKKRRIKNVRACL